MKLRFDLALNTASFDFYSYMVMGAAKGATEVIFGTDSVKKTFIGEPAMRKRFHSIVEPGPALLGLPHSFGPGGVKPHGPHLRELVAFYREGNSFPKLRTVLPKRDVEYTVTLRRYDYIPQRNSNEEAWRAFAAEIGALVIEDYNVKPIHIHERMALYAGARMNFGVVNGPMHLCVLSDYPFMMFACHQAENAFRICGIGRGANYPWAGDNQMTIWQPDDLPTIRRRFAEWRERTH
jgi:hypothetical protein